MSPITRRGLQVCPFWVPPAGSPVRLIHLAPVLHPPLIEARRSGAERISGGLQVYNCRVGRTLETRGRFVEEEFNEHGIALVGLYNFTRCE